MPATIGSEQAPEGPAEFPTAYFGTRTEALTWLATWLRRSIQRAIHDQLNKGESLHALRRGLLFANLGQIRRRDTGDQDLQGECLTLLTNAIVCWNTVYTGVAIDHLSAHGHIVTNEQRGRLSPAGHQHVNFYGRYDFDLSAHPTDGHLRPLREGTAAWCV